MTHQVGVDASVATGDEASVRCLPDTIACAVVVEIRAQSSGLTADAIFPDLVLPGSFLCVERLNGACGLWGILMRATRLPACCVEFPAVPGAAAMPTCFSTRRIRRMRPAGRVWQSSAVGFCRPWLRAVADGFADDANF